MIDEEFTWRIDEMLKDGLLSLLYRLERLEEWSGLVTHATSLERLPPISNDKERDLVTASIRSRVELLEKMLGE